MVSKHSAVRSIRLQNEAWEWLAKEAERLETTVNGVVAGMVDRERLAPLQPIQNAAAVGLKTVSKPSGNAAWSAEPRALGAKFQPVDALTGKPIEARKPMQKTVKGKK